MCNDEDCRGRARSSPSSKRSNQNVCVAALIPRYPAQRNATLRQPHLERMRYIFLQCLIASSCNAMITSPLTPKIAAKVLALLMPITGFLPDREALGSGVSIPSAVTKFYPLPEEEMITSYNRGNSYLISGRFEDALAEFSRAAEIDPTKSDIFLSKGIAEEKLFKWEEAIADYQQANELFRKKQFFPRDDPTAISNLANAETGLERWEDAYKDFARAASLNPEFLAPQIGKSLVAYQLGRPAETFAFFQSLAIKYPSYADANAVLAMLYFEKDDIDNAKECWELALEQDSRYKDIDWVLNIRRWPPKLVSTLSEALRLTPNFEKSAKL